MQYRQNVKVYGCTKQQFSLFIQFLVKNNNKYDEIIKKSIEKTKNVITIEDGTKINGLGTAIEELIVENNLQDIKFEKQAWPDEFLKQCTEWRKDG